jgi:hypothetical protein
VRLIKCCRENYRVSFTQREIARLNVREKMARLRDAASPSIGVAARYAAESESDSPVRRDQDSDRGSKAN